MSGAEDVSPPAASAWPAVSPAAAVGVRAPRVGLFRKYVVALVGLVAAALLVNAGAEFWFSFRESKAALLNLQQEKADAAAQRIGEFVVEIEHQIGWTTLPLWGSAPIDQRRYDFVRLLREVPAITALSDLDGAGKEQLKVSRLAIDVVGSGADFSHTPQFTEARAHRMWLGPVYFRKQSEPYMTMAMARAGQDAGVTVAEINLKLIWDVVTRLRIGEGGYAYVVDRHGKLIADPDISRVLRDTDLSRLPQVAAALDRMAGRKSTEPRVTAAENGSGQALSAHATIMPPGWIVFVEVPLSQAFAPLYRSALRDGFWLVLALVGAALAGLVLARRMTGPIHALQAGAARIGAGALGSRIEIHSGDELESLADQFNDMAGRLEASYTDLERKVEERTAELSEALEQQQAVAEVLGVVNASPGNLAPVFDAVLEKALLLCGASHGTLVTFDGEYFRVAADRGERRPEFLEWAGSDLLPQPTSAMAMPRLLAGESVIHIRDMIDDELYRAGNPVRRALVDLGGFRTLLSVALRRDETLLGAIHVYRTEMRPFSDKQIALLQNFAAQAVIAMENARLLGEIRQRQAELRVTFDNMADGVAMFDADLRLAAWNRNFQEIVGLPDDFLAAPRRYADYVRLLGARGEFGAIDIEAEIARLRQRTGDQYRLERTRPDGAIIEVRHNPMPGGGFVVIYSDITERKRSEGEIRAARDAAETALGELKMAQASLIQAEKMASLGQLTAGIAHEIKNPLNFVNNFASLSNELLAELKDIAGPAIATLAADVRADLDETIGLLSGNLDKIAEHGRRADNIVKSMLEHSRGVSGERRTVDLNALIEEALNLAYHGARAQNPGFNITLERDFDPAVPPIELVPQDMTRVFLNLFGNGFYAAGKRAQAGAEPGFRPLLRVATRADGAAVEIRVRDNGTGISAAIRDKLFQPFFTTKPTGEGTGLGLSISYDIVTQQHGGTIAVASEEGVFTEFTIRLPCAATTIATTVGKNIA